MTSRNVIKASRVAHNLEEAGVDLRKSVKRKWSIAVILACAAFLVLLSAAVFGIVEQNKIANQNKSHIDCIVKLLATPQKPGTTHKFITNPSETCNINFN